MAKVHFIKVGNGDCTIIQHNSGRVTMVDICGGNKSCSKAEARLLEALDKPRGNFAMCKHPTNPIEYIESLGIKSIFRFILTHPDMDHLDGLDNLMNTISVINFWDSGARKDKPDFKGSPYNEKDWDRYSSIINNQESDVTVVTPRAGSRFQFANENQEETSDIDGLYIVSPNKELVDEANEKQEFNDASYILSYWSNGGKIIVPGDAHDNSWENAIENYKDDIEDCSILLAPHHGRKSDRDYSYLNVTNPTLSLLGCAPSKDLAYSAWSNRDLYYFTQNQAGNTVLEISKNVIEIYLENEKYVEKSGGDTSITNAQGYFYLGKISNNI